MKSAPHVVKAEDIYNDGYGQRVFARVLSDDRLDAGALKLLYTYTLFENMRNSKINPSVQLLARLSNVSDRSVRRWRRQLERCGYIAVEGVPGKPNVIHVDFDRGGSRAREVPWDKELRGNPDTRVTPTPDRHVTSPWTPLSPKNLKKRMSTFSKEKEKESNDESPFDDYTKSKQRTKGIHNLVKLFYGLIGKP